MTDGCYDRGSEAYDGFQDIKVIQFLYTTSTTTDKGDYREVKLIKSL